MNQQFPQPISVDGYQSLFQGCALSEKVRVENGNFFRTMNLISVPTIGPSLNFTMVYNSRSAGSTQGFGYGWNHNWQVRIEPSSTAPAFVDESGRRFVFLDNSGTWELDLDEGLFDKLTLTSLPGDEWQIAYYPDGNTFQFDDTGRLVRCTDTLGNSLELSYVSDQLTEIEENCVGVTVGRKILIAYATDTITVTDPGSNEWVLELDEDGNLVEVQGPEGCITTFTYDDPEDHLITGRIDPVPRDPEEMPLVDQEWNYTFGNSGELLTVTDSRGEVLTYSYSDTYREYTSPENEISVLFRRTTLVDANAQTWRYVFDLTGNLRRIIDPNNHQRRFFWGPQSQLLYESSGPLNFDPWNFGTALSYLGVRDQANMRFRRYIYDLRGNLVLAVDGNGLMTHYEYAQDRLVSVTPGRANFSVQGEWQGHYGGDGYLLCGATGSADLASLPAYISAVSKGVGDVEPVITEITLVNDFHFRDPRDLRTLNESDGVVRATNGYWRSALDEEDVPYRRFQFTLEMEEETDFNLSLYTCATDIVPLYYVPMQYQEQLGYDVEMLVTDSVGTQSFRITNNAGGCWATFPVRSGEGDILVEIRARGNNATRVEDGVDFDLSVVGDAVLSAIAFDPYENRTTRMAYNEAGQLVGVVDGAGNTWTREYDELDGTLTSSLEPGQTNPTLYFYEDDYKNLTSVEDPLGGTTTFVYDLNGNVTSVTDADLHTTLFTLDGRNRVVEVEDAAGNSSFRTYDAGGRLTESEDQEGRVTAFAYKHQRFWKITDALLQTTSMTYTDSGQVETVTDARSKVTSFSYDNADRLIETEYADQAKLLYALDSLGRVTGVTSPNGNQDDLDAIVLEGAKNVLYNPSGQEGKHYEVESLDDPLGEISPRYWTPNASAKRGVEATGQAYFPLTSTAHTWEQKNTPLSAGCRYLAHFLVRKEDGTSGTTEARLEFQHRLHKDYPSTTHSALATTVVGEEHAPTTQDWEQVPRSRFDVPGDIQTSLHRPGLASARVKLSSGSAPLGAKNLQLQRLSTCFEFDGENLREVCFPDGARQRTEYDRLGRAFLTRDPDGRTILREFDMLDRVIHVVDSLGNELFFEYNEKMDLVLFRLRSLGVDQDTEFEWDALHRLKVIRYPDATTELFEYSAGGDLTSYVDNLSQERVYHYDELHRLDLITYPDTTTVVLSYDKVGNLLATVERDSNGWTYGYDDLNRLTSQQYTGQVELKSEYNETGQRMSLKESTVGPDEVIWSVPSLGRDDVSRLLTVEDVNADTTEMQYDVDGRCTRIDHNNSLSDLMKYDIVGKLLSKVVEGSETLMEMHYGYSLAGDRIAQQTDLDTFTYLTDGAGRLVEESHNRFCIHQPSIWKQGEFHCVELDESGQALQLLPFNDDFSGENLNLQRWRVESRQYSQSYVQSEMDTVGCELRHNDGLRYTYPRAFHSQAYIHRAPVDNSVGADNEQYLVNWSFYSEGIFPRSHAVDMYHSQVLSGDFDICMDYFNTTPGSGNGAVARMSVTPNVMEIPSPGSYEWFAVDLMKSVYGDSVSFRHTVPGATVAIGGTAMLTAGQIRMARTGSTYQAWHRAQGSPTWVSMGTYGPSPTYDLYVCISFEANQSASSFHLANLQRLTGSEVATEGVFTSAIYDAGRVVSWDRIQWTENLPTGCDVELEVCVADDYAEFEDFVSPPAWFGPSGGGAFTTPAGQSLPSGKTGRYAMVRAVLTGNGTDTPTLSDIQLTCNSASDTGSRVIRYAFDEAGNILKITTIDDLGVSEDVRDDDGWSSGDRINTLNQIMRQDVGGDTWTFSYDDNGNMTGKTNGVDTWIYTWNDENRLIRVQGPGSVDVTYIYDSAGRMMSRNDGTLTTFTWDKRDCIREQTGMSTTTYCIPGGQLTSFVRDGDRFDVHTDHVNSVRMVTDENGDVVLRAEFDAFGNELAGNFDSVPGGFHYRFVGALGCRQDPSSELVYMRQRWYDPTLQKFISRDPIGLRAGCNVYAYALNQPVKWNDPNGLAVPVPVPIPVPAGPAPTTLPNPTGLILMLLWWLWEYFDPSQDVEREPRPSPSPDSPDGPEPPREPDFCRIQYDICRVNCITNIDHDPDGCEWGPQQFPVPKHWKDKKYYHYYQDMFKCVEDCFQAFLICKRLKFTSPAQQPLGGWPPPWRGDTNGHLPPSPPPRGGKRKAA